MRQFSITEDKHTEIKLYYFSFYVLLCGGRTIFLSHISFIKQVFLFYYATTSCFYLGLFFKYFLIPDLLNTGDEE